MPQTVPNKPTKGAVEPTEASTAMPDCRLAEASSMAWRSDSVTHSLTGRRSCNWPWCVVW